MSTPTIDKPLLLRAIPARLPQQDRAALIPLAEQALTLPAMSVMDKRVVPPSGDKHDWANLADYTWPNPNTPDGLPYVDRDGLPNPEAQDYDRPTFHRFLLAVVRLTAASELTQDSRYARKSCELLQHWFTHPDTAMNPNQNYAHYVPGTGKGRKDGLIVCCAALPTLLDLWLLLKQKGFIDAASDRTMRSWVLRFLDWFTTDAMSLAHAEIRNNHGTFHKFLLTYLLLHAGRHDDAKAVLADALGPWIETQIAPDGAQPHEIGRTLSAQYSMFNLKALMSLARLGEHVGIDGWRRDETTSPIRRALQYLHRPASGETTWPHPQIEPPAWWYLASLCQAANHMYGDNTFDLTRIDAQTRLGCVPRQPTAFIPGWELLFAPSHQQHLPVDERREVTL